MNPETVIEPLFNHLLNGDRPAVRQLVGRVLAAGVTPAELSNDVIWPLHETLFRLRRSDQVSALAFGYAIRLLRTTIDQLQCGYAQSQRRQGSVLLFSGATEIEDLGGQIATDLLEADGWQVWFGGKLPATDDVVAEVHTRRPTWLVLFSSSKDDAARAREVISMLKELGGYPELRIALGGGIFNRAPGLAQELKVPFVAATPVGLTEVLSGRVPVAQDCERETVGRTTGGASARRKGVSAKASSTLEWREEAA